MKIKKDSLSQINTDNNSTPLERFLYKIEKYVAFTVLIMLLGLFHKAEGMAGFPLSWLNGTRIDPTRFFLSLCIVALLVIVADVLTMIGIRITEPVNDVDRTIHQYASTYAEYEDPAISEVKYNAAPVKSRSSSSERIPSKAASSKARNYEKTLASDYDKIKNIIRNNTNWDSEHSTSKSKTIKAKPLLNGASAKKNTDKKKASPTYLIILITIFIYLIGSGLATIYDSYHDSYNDEDWTPETYTEEVMYTDADALMSDFQSRDFESLEDLGGDQADIENVSDMFDWDDSYYEYLYTNFNYDSYPQSAVIRYRMITDDGLYLAALRYECNDFDDPDQDPTFSAFAICPYWEQDPDGDYEYGEASYSEYEGDETYEEYARAIADSSVSFGDAAIHDISILLW